MVRNYRGARPRIAASAYVDQSAQVIGDVEIGERSSVWMCAVVRGDVNHIRIGAETNVQDNAVLHVMNQQETKDLLASQLVPPAVSASPDEFNAYVQSEVKRWSKIIKDNNVKLD